MVSVNVLVAHWSGVPLEENDVSEWLSPSEGVVVYGCVRLVSLSDLASDSCPCFALGGCVWCVGGCGLPVLVYELGICAVLVVWVLLIALRPSLRVCASVLMVCYPCLTRGVRWYPG